MNNKSRHVIRIILGAYLFYLGVRIMMRVMKTEPSNGRIMGLLAVLFIVIGGGYAIFSIWNLVKMYKSENDKNSGLDETQELRIPEEAITSRTTSGPDETADERRKRTVVMQQAGPEENAAEADGHKDKKGEESSASGSSGSLQDDTNENSGSKTEESGSEPEEDSGREEKTADMQETEKSSEVM